MSGGILVIRQPVAQLVVRPQASSAAPAVLVARQEAARLVAVAAQGPAGQAGRDGGGNSSLGQITYTDRITGPEDRYEANTRQQIRLAPGSTTVRSRLLPPFEGHVFVRDDRFWPHAPDDAYDIHVNLIVMADQAGTKIKVDVDSGSVFGPLQADDKSLFEAAGVAERVTFNFSIQALDTTLENGAAFFLKATKPITILSEAIYIVPQSVQPSQTS